MKPATNLLTNNYHSVLEQYFQIQIFKGTKTCTPAQMSIHVWRDCAITTLEDEASTDATLA